MSAGVWRDITLTCDWCGETIFASHMELMDPRLTDVRRRAAKLNGWQTGVKNPGGRKRLDFCDRHRTDGR